MPLLRRLFRSVEDPAKPLTSATLIDALGGTPTASGIAVTEEKALGVTAVLRAVAIIAGVGAATPVKTYRFGTRTRVTVRILDTPHPEITPFEFWEMAWAYALLWGNAYLFKQRDALGRLVELWLIHPARVRVEIDRDADGPNFGRKRFEVVLASGRRASYTSDDICHIPGLGYDGLQGFSVIRVARQSLGIAMAADEYAARFYSQDATPGGVLEVEGELSDTAWRRMKSQWNALHKGVAKSHELGILEGGAKWKSVGIPPEDAQLLITRRFSVSEVARMFGLPPHLLADVEKSTSWGTGIEQQNIGLVVYTLGPWFARFEQRITRELTGAGIFAEYDVNGLLRGDMKTRFTSYAQGIQWGWLSRDEVRAYENLEPIPEGEGSKFLVPTNMQVLDEDEPEPPDEPKDPPSDEEADDDEDD